MCDPSRGFVQHSAHLGQKKRDQSLEYEHDVQRWAHHDVLIWIMKDEHDTPTLTAQIEVLKYTFTWVVQHKQRGEWVKKITFIVRSQESVDTEVPYVPK
jgi:hypothetical protein